MQPFWQLEWTTQRASSHTFWELKYKRMGDFYEYIWDAIKKGTINTVSSAAGTGTVL